MDKHQISNQEGNAMNSRNPAKNEKPKKGGFRAFSGLPEVCRYFAQESFSTTGVNDNSPNENGSWPAGKNDAFSCVGSALKNAERDAEKELKLQKLLAAQVKAHLSRSEVREKIVAFMRYHDDIPNAQITASLLAMIRQYAPGKAANAKDIAGLAASSVDGIAEWFARDKVFPLLASVGLVAPRENARGYIWVDLDAKRKAQRDAFIQLVKNVAKPGFPELAEEQRKYAAAVKANELAKRRAEIARQTAALVAQTDQSEAARKDSNTKVILAAVAAALFAGGVLVAKYGDSPQSENKNAVAYESAPVYDVEKMLSESNPDFYDLPMAEQAELIRQAEAAFAE